MRHIGSGSTTRAGVRGVRGAALVLIALCGMMLAPALADAVTTKKPVNTVAPSVTGTPAPGQTLTCTPGSWTSNPTVFTYAWLHDGAPIAGQTANTYVVQASDRGHTISCQVTAGKQVGEYTLIGLATGTYKVVFSSFGSESDYLSQYFNGKPLESEAGPVSATVGSTTTGINAALQTGGGISGTVTDASTHAPLSKILVCTRGTSDLCASTNAAGAYTITRLPSGTYKVVFEGQDSPTTYLTQYYKGKASEGEAEPVSVTAPGTTSGINAEMQVGAEIKGTVTDASTHVHLAHIDVCVTGPADVCASTNEAGEYTVSGLVSGSYDVRFAPEEGTIFGGSEGGNYLPQYYNGKASEAEAEPVVVVSPNTYSGIDAEMHPGGQIKGTVTDASTHAALEGFDVCAVSAGGESTCGITNASGGYTLSGLATGSYKVEFIAGFESFFGTGGSYVTQYYNGKASLAEAEAVVVSSPSTTGGINAEMHSGGQISGKVTDAATHGALANFEVCAYPAAGGGFGFYCATTNAAGEYTITGLPTGSFTVEFSAYNCLGEVCETQANYVTQYYSGKALRTEGAAVAVTAPDLTAGINAEMHGGGEISGKVTSALTGVPVGGVEVCANNTVKEAPGSCTTTNAAASSATATSGNGAVVPAPNSTFTMIKAPKFDAKADQLDFFFRVVDAGRFTWGLFFKNADVGFADSLGVSLQSNAVAANAASTQVLAEAARKHGSKGCRKGTTRHHGRCVHTLVAFGAGSQSVAAGSVEVKVQASSKAIKALKAGHTLHVSGTFIFQSVFGGPAVAKQESAVVRLPRKHAKRQGKGKRR